MVYVIITLSCEDYNVGIMQLIEMAEMNMNNGEEYENDFTVFTKPSDEVLLLRILTRFPQYHFLNRSFVQYGSLIGPTLPHHKAISLVLVRALLHDQ
jgi:hypothetical protein